MLLRLGFEMAAVNNLKISFNKQECLYKLEQFLILINILKGSDINYKLDIL